MKVSGAQKEAKAAVTHSPAAVLHRMGHGIWAMDNSLVHLAPSSAFSACFLPPLTVNPRRIKIMSKRPRRNHAPTFKAKVALDALKGSQTIVELSERYQVQPNQITDWKKQLLEHADEVLKIGHRNKVPSSKIFTRKSANCRWRMIFYQARSVASAMRAQRNDRQGG